MELSYIKGISDKRIDELNGMGIYSAEDLVRHFPKNYLDMRSVTRLNEVEHNDFALIKAVVVIEPELVPTFNKRKLSLVKTVCSSDGDFFDVVWFNQPYVRDKLKVNTEYLFWGRVRNRFGVPNLTNPTFEPVENNNNLKGIVPVYALKGSITQRIMRQAIDNALTKVAIKSVIPDRFLSKYSLPKLDEAYKIVHSPQNFEEKDAASERIAIEEYFALISAFKFIKGGREQVRLNNYSVSARDMQEFVARFGFEFTDGQKKAVNEIFSDLRAPTVMNRLLQGDVGCGKTAVALCAIYIAAKSGYQAVMLAPTEVLARQNFELIKKYLPDFFCTFLSGSSTKEEKKLVKADISSGKCTVLCGTHAVIQDDVTFNNLALCVCDEQQRFGVAQRNNLVEKGKAPDVLVMSATPIPRTLSLIIYGDLEISTIYDKPIQRIDVKTSIVLPEKYDKMLEYIKGEIEKGRQAFFVCPKIEGNDEGTALSAKELYNELRIKLPTISVELLHGRMKDKEKTAIMTDFKNRKFDILVSTTVIEVGIDVPNATIMTIYGADCFGLSQLHQLRGRVGRGSFESYCFLLSDNPSESAFERLNALKDNYDGFKISQIDFETRGGGDFFGTKQSGKIVTDLGGLRYSTSAIFIAKQLVEEVFASGESLEDVKILARQKYRRLKDVIMN